ncbi:Phospholipid scramblase 2 [Holothuria leucospilota]|uniref:Phospholipid scramblase n=1 Tax=Holothuria leucospilota TaxID=206669 RepID=A0A9Q1HIX9_HOLLE|nr:Phospholipid scramblase 2 [Holothuria leucospilota]
MERQTGYEPAQGGPCTNPVTVPLSTMSPPGQVASGQPGQAQPVQWMPIPPTIPGCPPGLEYLCQLDQILVHQQVELLEVLTHLEGQNKYKIKNSLGQQIFFAKEESDFLSRQHLRSGRSFIMHVVNNDNQEVIRVIRPSQNCVANIWKGVAEVFETRLRNLPGSLWSSHLEVLDASLKPVLKIRGPCCYCEGAHDIDFRVMTPDESQQIGNISKQWSGHLQERYTNADNFCINFPMDLDVRVKATLLGALFLMDFMMFEQRPMYNNQVQRY